MAASEVKEATGEKQKIKCVVWDLDNTLWEGTLLEDDNVYLCKGILDIIKTLDGRGILQSIASRNEYDVVMEKLREFGIAEYFIYPQITWDAKSISVGNIAKSINIGLDTVAFIDDQPFELDEVKYMLKDVLCIDAAYIYKMIDMPEMNPDFVTEDSGIRRLMYMSDIERNKLEELFEGSQEEFLASLDMRLTIAPVGESDLQRAEELTVRTHQLNTTGYTYSYEELDSLRKSPNHKILMASIEDKYGTYGKIGIALIEYVDNVWIIKLLLMSCRVMSRGIGTIIINHVLKMAKNANVRLLAEFVPTDRNRMMYASYKFAGFREIEENDGLVIFENDLSHIQTFPEYVKVDIIEQMDIDKID